MRQAIEDQLYRVIVRVSEQERKKNSKLLRKTVYLLRALRCVVEEMKLQERAMKNALGANET